MILLDIEGSGELAFVIAKKITQLDLKLPIIVLSNLTRFHEREIFYDIGVKACIPKSLINDLDLEIMKALNIVTGNYNYIQLSSDDKKLLIGICEGKTNLELGEILFVEQTTVEYRCRKLSNKIGVINKKQFLIAFAIKYGFWMP